MRKSIQIVLIGMLLPFFFTACGTTSGIHYRGTDLSLYLNEIPVDIQVSALYKKRTNFKSLFLNQYILRTVKGEVLVYENGRTDLSYEFEPTLIRTIDVIFETKKKIPVYLRGHLHAYQLILPDGRVLNLIAQQDNTQEIKLLYGMSTPLMNKILKNLDPSAPDVRYTHVVQLKSTLHSIMTHWNDRKVHFYPLIVPLTRLMTGF